MFQESGAAVYYRADSDFSSPAALMKAKLGRLPASDILDIELATALRAEGIEAHGQIAHPDPFTAAMQAVSDERIDQIIVSTFPGERSGWLKRDVVGRLRKETRIPVEHVVVEAAAVGAAR